jgi:thiol-disulfide isomerase/thioredoxin
MPKPEIIEKALNQIRKRAVNYVYFFNHLTSPEWIEPLYSNGMFQRPPLPEREEGNISFPPWPESRYLVRMASKSPELVLSTIIKIPETENIRVHEDFAEAALAMPPDIAVRLIKKEIDWIKSQQHLYFLPEIYGKLISHLARGGQVDYALNLARKLLAVNPTIGEYKEEKISLMPSSPLIRFNIWYYEQILKNNIPDLVITAKECALKLLCDLLVDVIRFSDKSADETVEEYSFIWRPAIEEHDQNHRIHEINDLIVSAVRDVADELIETKGKIVLEIIEGQKFKVFNRIGLYLRRKWPEIDPDGTDNLVINPNVFDDIHLHHEFYLLIAEQFDKLSPIIQKAYLDLIKQAVDVGTRFDIREREYGNQPRPEEIESYVRRWQYKKLWPIQAFLDQEWRERFNTLKEELGELDHPEFYSYFSKGWVGPISPKGIEDLKSMNIDELISFLNSWEPSENPMAPSPEGLGRQLTTLVSSNPECYSVDAKKFENLNPTYVRALFSGFREALKQSKSFQWKQILNLCRWVIDQPQEIPERKDEYMDIDPDWGWTRKAIADLLAAAFESDSLPYELRKETWEVLRPITDDPDPTIEHEKQYGGSNMDHATLSINTTRGLSMHAVVQYSLWVRQHIEKTLDDKEHVAVGLEEMPEARDILEHHLDPTFDPSLAIHSVYGQWFPWIVLLDEKWAAQNIPNIFPKDRSLYDAAWGTYIVYCKPYDIVLDLLREEYNRAIDNIEVLSEDQPPFVNYNKRLVEHIMSYYWRGKINIDEPDGLLTRFFTKAPEEFRGQAIEFIGRNLYNSKESIDSEILNRLKKLWETRINAIHVTQKDNISTELVSFGWWFVSAKFDDDWAISQLEDLIELTNGKIYPDYLVIERLAELSKTMPLFTVKCLAQIFESDKDKWRIHSFVDNMRIIIGTALKSTDDVAYKAAAEFVGRLLASGYLDFRDLITETDE